MSDQPGVRPSPADKLFGKIALKNKLITEELLRKSLAELPTGSDLASFLVSKGRVSEKHATQIRQKVEERLDGGGVATAERGSEAKPREGALTPDQVAQQDWSDLAGKPLGEYLARARKVGASDFHFQNDAPPMLRLHGVLVRVKHPVLNPQDTERAIRELLTEKQWKFVDEHLDLDFCYEKESHGRYRTNVFRQRKGWDIVFRLIPDHVPTLEELHLPDILRQFTKYNQGIVLVTGPAGSGKSSTMAALIDIINEEHEDHVVTVEDPIEFMFESKNCNVNQRHVREHTATFASALRSAMRADPDVIMVGEMRDLETISMAITAAETGHLVIGTLHTTNAVRSIDRIIDVFPPREQEQIRAMVSESMRGVISQQLLTRADGLGVEPAVEIMFSTTAVANLIRESRTYQLLSVLQTGKKQGMITMDDSIRGLLNRGLITRDTAIFHAEVPDTFRK
jgi:twitching motility protein PilT